MNRRGAVSILAAGSMALMIGAAALAVDIGAIFLNSRQLQGAADLAAIAAAQDLPNAANAAARSVEISFPGRTIGVAVNTGRYDAEPLLPAAQRFRAGAASTNAVRVSLQREAPLFFGRVFSRSRTSVTRSAVAMESRLASFQIGTRLAALDGGAANALLSALTGSTVSLSVMDYNALASAQVDLFDYLDALRTRANLTAASYNEVLAADIEAPKALSAIADVASGVDKARAAQALTSLAGAAAPAPRTRLGKAIDVGLYGAQDSASLGSVRRVEVSALDLSSAILQVANGGRQVELDLDVAAPGIADVKAWLAIGERPNASPWLAVTRSATPVIRTAQMRLYVEASLTVAGLANVRLPVLLELAPAQAKLSEITCGANPRVTVSVAPSIGALAVADIDKSKLNDFKHTLERKPAKLASALLMSVEGAAAIDLGGEQWRNLTFDAADIRAGKIKSVATQDLAAVAAGDLVEDMNLTVKTLGFGVNAGAVTALLAPVLEAAAPALDTTLNKLTNVLGLRLGEADVRVNGVRCAGAALVG